MPDSISPDLVAAWRDHNTVLRTVDIDLPRPRHRDHLARPEAVTLEQELLNLLMREQRL